ncbi:hypothetical protein TWF281_011350 [Arthrobotrys megalospora]
MNYETTLKCPEGFPPRCCEPLDLATTAFVLSHEQVDNLLKLKARHESTKIMTCSFCEEKIFDASTFISDSAAYCTNCNKLTCVACGKEMHKDVCPQSQGIEGLQELVREFGWSPCPKCNQVVEKNEGCNHVCCRCGTHFCYGCREPIRTYDSYGCTCYKKVPRKQISFGESFQTAGDTSASSQWAYERMVPTYRKESIAKQTRFDNLKVLITAARQKDAKASKLVEEMAGLRAQLLGSRAKLNNGGATDSCLNQKTQMKKKVAEGTLSVIDAATTAVASNPAKRKITRSANREGVEGEEGLQTEDTSPVSARTRKKVKVI